MFTVRGAYKPSGGLFALDVDTDAEGAVVMTCPDWLRAAAEDSEGDTFSGTPTGPTYPLSLDDPSSILAWALETTDDPEFFGDYPEPYASDLEGDDDPQPDDVY